MNLTKAFGLVILVVLTSACGQSPRNVELGEFAPYVERFIQLSYEEGNPVEVNNLVMRFSDQLKERENGVCILRKGKAPEILIKPEVWDSMSEEAREALVFHELGHCLLFRVHENSVDESGVPVSLMHAYRLRDEYYKDNRQNYVGELFSRAHEIF